MEDNPFYLIAGPVFQAQGRYQVPGDGLAFAVFIRREDYFIRALRFFFQKIHLLAAFGRDDVFGLKSFFNVYPQGGFGKVAHMAVGRFHFEIPS